MAHQQVKMNLVCPDCGAGLLFSVEEVVWHSKSINPQTGKLVDRVKKKSNGNANNLCKVECTECSWESYDGMRTFPKYINSIEPEDVVKFTESVEAKSLK